jgi:hypothetical protein
MPKKKRPLSDKAEPIEPLVPRFTFGKFRGRTVDEVMRVESSYAAWFADKIDSCLELKDAIKSHPLFPAAWERYVERQRRIQQNIEWKQGSFSQPTLENLCDELFNPDKLTGRESENGSDSKSEAG